MLARREEVEQAVCARIFAIADPVEVKDSTYLEGLRRAVGAAVDYALAGIGSSDLSSSAVPPELLVQARLAAQNGVGLDVVLRRYIAGYTVLGDFLIDGATPSLSAGQLECLLRAQAARFDLIIRGVSEEHRREEDSCASAGFSRTEQRKLELVHRLLDGVPLDSVELGYDLAGTHVAVAGRGEGIHESLRELASRLSCRSLVLHPERETVWGWLRLEGRVDMDKLMRLARATFPPQVSLALGEPGDGPSGWRLSHRQAQAALPIATGSPGSAVRYGDVALVASIRQDELLATSLTKLYLEPLQQGRGGGETAQETLRAYFASSRNISSTAAALGVSRQTVTTRLRAIEEMIGRPIEGCATEIELAIRIEGG